MRESDEVAGDDTLIDLVERNVALWKIGAEPREIAGIPVDGVRGEAALHPKMLDVVIQAPIEGRWHICGYHEPPIGPTS